MMSGGTNLTLRQRQAVLYISIEQVYRVAYRFSPQIASKWMQFEAKISAGYFAPVTPLCIVPLITCRDHLSTPRHLIYYYSLADFWDSGINRQD